MGNGEGQGQALEGQAELGHVNENTTCSAHTHEPRKRETDFSELRLRLSWGKRGVRCLEGAVKGQESFSRASRTSRLRVYLQIRNSATQGKRFLASCFGPPPFLCLWNLYYEFLGFMKPKSVPLNASETAGRHRPYEKCLRVNAHTYVHRYLHHLSPYLFICVPREIHMATDSHK